VDGRFPVQVLDWGSNLPQQGHDYTVRACGVAPDGITGVYVKALLLCELRNANGERGELSFYLLRFREVLLENERVENRAKDKETVGVAVNSSRPCCMIARQ
jgi:hypothetical protein